MQSKPTSVLLKPDVLSLIKEAAAKLGIPHTIFIRMAAKKEAERVLAQKERARRRAA